MLQCVFIIYVKAADKVSVKIVMFLTMPSIHLKLMRKHLRKTLPLDTKTMDMNLDTNVKAPESQYFHVSLFCLRIRCHCLCRKRISKNKFAIPSVLFNLFA